MGGLVGLTLSLLLVREEKPLSSLKGISGACDQWKAHLRGLSFTLKRAYMGPIVAGRHEPRCGRPQTHCVVEGAGRHLLERQGAQLSYQNTNTRILGLSQGSPMLGKYVSAMCALGRRGQ